MIRVRIVTEIIVIALKLLGLAKRLHPKLFGTFRVVLLEAIQPQPNKGLQSDPPSALGGLCICGKPFGHREVCLPEKTAGS